MNPWTPPTNYVTGSLPPPSHISELKINSSPQQQIPSLIYVYPCRSEYRIETQTVPHSTERKPTIAVATEYTIKTACRHTETKGLSDKPARNRKSFANWLSKKGKCRECYVKDNRDDFEKRRLEIAQLNVATSVVEAPETDLDAEAAKVADFWESQGWGEAQHGGEAIDERRIFVYTPLSTRGMYTVSKTEGRVLKVLQMDSLCAREFGNNSPVYFGDFEERFSSSPAENSSSAR